MINLFTLFILFFYEYMEKCYYANKLFNASLMLG